MKIYEWSYWVEPPHCRVIEKRAYGEDENWLSRISRKVWGGLGAISGALTGAYEKATGNDQGSWGDYIRTGYHVAHDNADRIVGGMAEGAAAVVPFVPVEPISNIVDNSYAEDNVGYRKLGNGVAAHMRQGSQYAGALAGLAAQAKPIGKLFGKIQKPLTSTMRVGTNMALDSSLPAWQSLAGAGSAVTSADLTSRLWGLDYPYNNIISPVRDLASGFVDWARGKTLDEYEEQ